jgi:ABC-type nitrate/sulfonate/bicarbonate transport system permease component
MANSRIVWRIAAALVLLLLWEGLSAAVGRNSLPGPLATAAALGRLLFHAPLWAALGLTIQSTLLGLLIAAVIAIPAGLLVASSRFATASSRISISFLGSIPPISFLPLALLLFGSTTPMKLMVIGYGACWPLLVRTMDALRDIHAVQHDVADAFVLKARIRWFRVYLPASLPGILTGIRISLTISLLLSIGCEYVGGASGIGAELLNAQVNGRAADVQAYAVLAAVLGLLLNQVLRAVERQSISWHPSVRTAGTR